MGILDEAKASSGARDFMRRDLAQTEEDAAVVEAKIAHPVDTAKDLIAAIEKRMAHTQPMSDLDQNMWSKFKAHLESMVGAHETPEAVAEPKPTPDPVVIPAPVAQPQSPAPASQTVANS